MPLLDTLVQSLGHGMFLKKQADDAADAKKQEMVAHMALNSIQNVRPEDLPKAWQHIEKIVTAKNAKQAHEALGEMATSMVSEDPQQEQKVQTQNDLGKAIFDQGMPEGKSIQQDPGAYAKGKIRIKTPEGDEQRKINIYTAQQKVVAANRMNLEAQKAKDKIAQIEAQNKGKGTKLGTTYDEDRNVTIVHFRENATGEVKSYEVPGTTGQVYSAQQRAETAEKVLTARKEYESNRLKQQMDIHNDKMSQWDKSRALKAQMYISKTQNTGVASQARMMMTKIKQANINANEAYAIAARKDTPEEARIAATKRFEEETNNAKTLQDQLEQFTTAQPDFSTIEELAPTPTTGANPATSTPSATTRTSGSATIKSAKASFYGKGK